MLAPACGHLDNPLPTFGRAQDTAEGGHALSLEIGHGRLIGRDHKIFDQFLRAILLLDPEIGQHLTLKHGSWLNRFKTQRSLLVSSCLEPLRDLVLEAELRIEAGDGLDPLRRGRLPCKPGGDAVIGQLRVVADQGPKEGRTENRPILRNHHLHDDREAVLPFAERRQIGRQLFRQHGKHVAGRIDRRRIVLGMSIQGGFLRDQRIHVGNRDQDLHRPIRMWFSHGELVEVSGIVVVDRRPE